MLPSFSSNVTVWIWGRTFRTAASNAFHWRNLRIPISSRGRLTLLRDAILLGNAKPSRHKNHGEIVVLVSYFDELSMRQVSDTSKF